MYQLVIFVLLSTFTILFAYTPSQAVVAAHNIPQVQDFKLSIEYAIGLVIFPAVILCLGILSLLGFQFFLCCRGCCTGCCNCFCCCIKYDEDFEFNREKVHRIRLIARICFFIFIVLALISTGLSFLGNSYIQNAFQKTAETTTGLGDIFRRIQANIAKISTLTQDASQNYFINPNSKCYDALDSQSIRLTISSAANTTISTAQDINKVIALFPDLFDTGTDYINNEAIPKEKLTFYILFAITITIIFILMATYWCKSKKFLTLNMIFIEIIVFTLTLATAILMIFVHLSGDFCMDPGGNLANLVPGNNAKQLLSYYLQCQGSNPFGVEYTDIQTKVQNDINNTITTNYNDLVTYLNNNGGSTLCLDNIIYDINGAVTAILNILNELTCSSTSALFQHGIEKGYCVEAVNGFFTFWILYLLISSFLFLSLISATYFYDEFDDYHAMCENIHLDSPPITARAGLL